MENKKTFGAYVLQRRRELGMTQKELAERCQVDVTTMSRSLDKLQKSGFLQRQPDPSSRRSFLVCLTETGRQEAQIVRNLLTYMDEQTW